MDVNTYLPEWLDTLRQCIAKGIEDAAGIYHDECDRETHRGEHDSESRADEEKFPQPEIVLALDGVEQGDSGENPPGVPRMNEHRNKT
jgi:hypothetical protein